MLPYDELLTHGDEPRYGHEGTSLQNATPDAGEASREQAMRQKRQRCQREEYIDEQQRHHQGEAGLGRGAAAWGIVLSLPCLYRNGGARQRLKGHDEEPPRPSDTCTKPDKGRALFLPAEG